MRIVLLLSALALGACASITEHRTGLTEDAQLQPCPKAPRCVSSQRAREDRVVAPLRLRTADEQTWLGLLAVLENQDRTSVVEQNRNYARAEVVSPWRFYTDDVELLRSDNGLRVDVRSSGRIGWYDFNVNRDRIDQLRAAFRQAGLLAPE